MDIVWHGPNKTIRAKLGHIGGDDLDLLDIEKPAKTDNIKVSDIIVLPEDRISELKEKIYTVTGVIPANQYLYWENDDGQHPLSYEIRLDGLISLNIQSRLDQGPHLLGLPIDEALFRQRDALELVAYDYFHNIQGLLDNRIKVLHLYNLADLITTKTTDSHTLALWYHSFVRLYFPIWTLEAFQIWLNNPDELKVVFPDLVPNIDKLRKSYEHQISVMGRFKIGATNTVIRAATWQTTSNEAIVRIPDLLNQIRTDSTVPWIRIVHRDRTITKMNIQYGERAYEHTRHRVSLDNGAMICCRLSDHDYAQLLIHETGPVQVKTFWSEEQQMQYPKLQSLITKFCNPVIDRINQSGRKILSSRWGLAKLSPELSTYTNLTLNMFWKKQLTPSQFGLLIETLKLDAGSGILSVEDSTNQIQGFRFHKGMFQNRSGEDYSYLTNVKTKQRWLATYMKGRSCSVVLRTTDVKFELTDVLELEIPIIQNYIENLISRVEPRLKSVVEKVQISNNRLKVLKSRDPVLFDFRTHGSNVVYSRICQKQRQPLSLTEFETVSYTKNHPKAKLVKFQNFSTTGSLYYTCPNPKFPFLSFIEGHPKNYCLPCCIMTDKKSQASCWESGLLEVEDDVSQPSRYIMNYGKGLEVGRLSQLPEQFQRFLIYNSRIVGNLRDITQPTYFLYGVPQQLVLPDVGYYFSLCHALQMQPAAVLRHAVEWLKKHPEMYNTFNSGVLPFYFDSWASLVTAVQELFRESGLPYIGRFVDWNELWMQIAEHVWGITTVIIEDTNVDNVGTSQSKHITGGFQIVLSKWVDSADQYFQPSRYLVVLRRLKKQRSLHSRNYYYAPVYLVIPQNFFKNLSIESRLYQLSDDLIQLLKQLTVGTMSSQINSLSPIIDKIKRIGISDLTWYGEAGQISWIGGKYAGKDVIVPVPSQPWAEKMTERPELQDLDLVSREMLEKILDKYQEPVLEVLVMRDTGMAIGLATGSGVWYMKPVKKTESANLSESVRWLWHHPDKINRMLRKTPTSLPAGPVMAKAQKSLLSYADYQKSVMQKLDRERNQKLRRQLANISKLSAKAREAAVKDLELTERDQERLRLTEFRLADQDYDFDGVTLNALKSAASAKEAAKIINHLVKEAPDNYVNMLAEELVHPLSRDYLLQSVLLPDPDFSLIQYPDEEIYIG